jgi:predicted peptidase
LALAAEARVRPRVRQPLDPDRIYLTGLSMGGEGTWDFVVLRPTTFACAVPLSGLYSDTTKAASIKNVPFWVCHSLADEQNGVANSQRMVADLLPWMFAWWKK